MKEPVKKYTDSGIEIKEVYTRSDVPQVSPTGGDLEGAPGSFPFTRGVQPDIDRKSVV